TRGIYHNEGMGALLAALLAVGDFWPKVAQTPYDALLAEGARLRTQAERSCLPPITCREGSPAFLAQQAGLRQAAAAFQHAAALRPEDPEAPYFAGTTLQRAHDYEAAATQYEESRRRRADGRANSTSASSSARRGRISANSSARWTNTCA